MSSSFGTITSLINQRFRLVGAVIVESYCREMEDGVLEHRGLPHGHTDLPHVGAHRILMMNDARAAV